ncbi:MAG: carboxypeptidase regulatory-like domain-containing protein, partial [Flavobacteriales bacterium]|nr:carboxypeptidase regulatory-like domain-containing protein [Flavobacteriales bacterium]
MRFNFIVSFFIFLSAITQAQTTISGNIADPAKAAIPYANIILSNPENAIIAYTFSDEFGHFI